MGGVPLPPEVGPAPPQPLSRVRRLASQVVEVGALAIAPEATRGRRQRGPGAARLPVDQEIHHLAPHGLSARHQEAAPPGRLRREHAPLLIDLQHERGPPEEGRNGAAEELGEPVTFRKQT